MLRHQILQIGFIGIGLSFLITVIAVFQFRIQEVWIVRINMVGCEQTAGKRVRRLQIFHIQIHTVFFRHGFAGMLQYIRRGPVRIAQRPLHPVMLHLIAENIISRLRPEHLKGFQMVGADISTLVRVDIRMVFIGSRYKSRIRFDPQNPADDIRRNIIPISPVCLSLLFRNRTVAMQKIYDISHILLQDCIKLLVKGIRRFHQSGFVIPCAMEKIERLLSLLVKFIKSFIKCRRLYGIDSDTVRVHLTDLLKPSGILLFCDCRLPRKITRFSKAHINTFNVDILKIRSVINAKVFPLRPEIIAYAVSNAGLCSVLGLYLHLSCFCFRCFNGFFACFSFLQCSILIIRRLRLYVYGSVSLPCRQILYFLSVFALTCRQ